MPATALDLDDLIELVERRGQGDVLECITEAETVVADLSRLGDRLVGYFVERARTEGHSWTAIGDHVGVTRQAAQQRFAARWSALTMGDLEQAGAFERVTARARDALLASETHARRLRSDAVGAEHLLLAVIDDRTTLAVRALRALGVDIRALRRGIDELGAGNTAPATDVPVSAPARRCLSRALDEALAFGHNYIGTEHLLLAALDERDAELTQLAIAHGIDRDALRTTIQDLLDAYLRDRE